jgi:beta-glucosidase
VGAYGKPLYVTENGIDDGSDTKRPDYLKGYIGAVRRAIASDVDVRGYFQWSLVDNLEWSEGFAAKFGLFSYDARTLRRTARPSARLYRQIAEGNRVP